MFIIFMVKRCVFIYFNNTSIMIFSTLHFSTTYLNYLIKPKIFLHVHFCWLTQFIYYHKYIFKAVDHCTLSIMVFFLRTPWLKQKTSCNPFRGLNFKPITLRIKAFYLVLHTFMFLMSKQWMSICIKEFQTQQRINKHIHIS